MISVIVPVYNQWHLVPRLLAGLATQTAEAKIEVLLVDNGSDIVPEFAREPDFVRRLYCATPGSYAARNHGARHARGELLVFTDADCEPQPGWLEAVSACLAKHDSTYTIVAGKVSVVSEAPITLAARYDMALGFPQERYVANGYGVTANLAVSRELFEREDGFDSNRLSGGDADFCRRAGQRGASVIYCDDAVVNHPARRSVDELIRKVRRLKGGQLRNGSFRRRLLGGLRSFLPPVRAWWRIWRSPVLSARHRVSVSMLQLLLWFVEMAETLRLLVGSTAERR